MFAKSVDVEHPQAARAGVHGGCFELLSVVRLVFLVDGNGNAPPPMCTGISMKV